MNALCQLSWIVFIPSPKITVILIMPIFYYQAAATLSRISEAQSYRVNYDIENIFIRTITRFANRTYKID